MKVFFIFLGLLNLSLVFIPPIVSAASLLQFVTAIWIFSLAYIEVKNEKKL